MSNLRTSISILAVVAGLTMAVPHTAYAQNAGGAKGPSMGGYPSDDSAIGQMGKHLDKINETDAKLHPQQGGTKPPVKQPDPKPEEPSLAQKCWNGICSLVKLLPEVAIGTAIVDAVVGEPDEAAEQKAHNEAVDKAVKEKHEAEKREAEKPKSKAEQALEKLAQPKSKTAIAPKATELKVADLKHVETTKSVAAPATKLVTASRIEVSRPAINVARPTVNVVHPTVNIARPAIAVQPPTIRIPPVVIRR